ncbi:DMT family transporter [Defluviimonas sp. WL0024]|uniref:DMT family transporter n=2 Tax=Albidovulum TaxID=205889 RepID=A0ABT3IZ96_9RHOB|nr:MULTISPECIES: DMT family transporter [Defluviimonas]MCU9849675.1 DMT family transporter [Defluviimonas sp. WL0024]MCW3780762.1 DMT family transporter [Defluviimonas salinarum]
MDARRLFLALFVIGGSWGLTAPLSKIVVMGGYRHFGIIFWQLVIGSALLGLWLVLARRRLPLTRPALSRYVFIALFGTILPNAAFYTAQEGLPAGLVAVFIALVPMFALPMAFGLGLERPEPVRFLGILAGLAGILMIVLPEASLPDRAALVFVPFALAAAALYAVEAAGLGRMGTAGLDPVQLLTGASLVGVVLVFPAVVASGSWITPALPLTDADAALVVTAAIHALAYAGYVWVVGHGGAVFAAQVAYIVTGTGVLWSMLILGERYSLWVWAALALVFAGLFLVQPRPSRREELGPFVLPATEPSIVFHEQQDR